MRLLALAFRDNPLNRAVYAGRGPRFRERANAAGMRSLLATARERGLVLAAGEAGRPEAVLVAAPPGGFPFPLPPLATRLRTLWHQGWDAARRWSRVHAVLSEAHPVGLHWYVAVLGVAPERQGRGVGRALLGRFLATVDAAGEPVYLETDRAENVGFYERAGFHVVHRLRVLDTPLWLLHRPARGAGRGGRS